METAIENVVVKNNPRMDFGDIDELTASVKDKGILEPLLVKKLDGDVVELIAGEKRLRSARAAGLSKVPIVFYEGDKTDIEEVKLIENMHRKDLNPVEEARAFKKYMDATKSSLETLAERLSKPKLYIERRLKIIDLPALKNGLCVSGYHLLPIYFLGLSPYDPKIGL